MLINKHLNRYLIEVNFYFVNYMKYFYKHVLICTIYLCAIVEKTLLICHKNEEIFKFNIQIFYYFKWPFPCLISEINN